MARSTLALCVVGAVALPGSAAAAAPLPDQWWFTSWAVEEDLWPAGKGQGVTVAVIDTGVQASLADLRGVVLAGTDAETGSGDGRTDNNPEFGQPGHGTQISTLIAAQGTGTGFLGVAPQAKILPVVAQTAGAQAKGIRFAADRGAKVINMSLALPGSCPSDMQDAVAYALGKDAVIVAGAGNDGADTNSSMFPANCKGVLAAGAVDVNLRPWVKTQRQPYVAVAAPGYFVGSVSPNGRYTANLAGTSQASALTSGIVALVRSKFPDMPNREVVRQIIASSKDIGPKGRDDQTGYGFIRPYRIMQGMIPKTSPNPVFAAYDTLPKPKAEDDSGAKGAPSSSNTSLLPFGIIGVAALVVIALAFFLSRRNRGKGAPAPLGPTPGPTPTFGAPYPPQGPPQPPPGYPPTRGDIPQQPQGGYPPQTQYDIPRQPPQ